MSVKDLVICMTNKDYEASLELHKIYAVVEPYENDPGDYRRIIDESGEDYLYPADWFEPVHLGSTLEARIVGSLSVT